MNVAFQLVEKTVKEASKHCYLNKPNHKMMFGGHNGPYFDVETPIRNTSHWLAAFSVQYAEKGERLFYEMGSKLCNFLLAPGVFERSGVLIHRQKAGKDWCNGVIGQAWAIEALVIAAHLLGRDDALKKAFSLADAFRFSKSIGAWTRIDPNNGKAQIDYTLNHQLWYAAALSMLDDKQYDRQINLFLDVLHAGGIRTRSSGCINHLLFASSLKSVALRCRYKLSEYKNKTLVFDKEIGYHLYNLHPLARLKCKFGHHAIFSSEKIKHALEYAFSSAFMDELEDNKYAYPYNAPGFEYPLIARAFGYQSELVGRAWQRQITKTYDDEIRSFSKNCPDPVTLNARIYELALDSYYDKFYKSS